MDSDNDGTYLTTLPDSRNPILFSVILDRVVYGRHLSERGVRADSKHHLTQNYSFGTLELIFQLLKESALKQIKLCAQGGVALVNVSGKIAQTKANRPRQTELP